MTNTINNENKITCEVVQDLLPSYVDGLASDDTARIIEEHVKECAECRSMLESMQSGGPAAPELDERDRKEIDFLKKSRSRGKRAVALGVILTLLVVGALIGTRLYIVGSEYNGQVACDIENKGDTVAVTVEPLDSLHVIRSVDFDVRDGIARGTIKSVLPGLRHGGSVLTELPAGDLREIWIGDDLYWADGQNISTKVSDLFKAGHDYVGDAPANGESLVALGIREDLGELENELQTEAEPYVWTITLLDDQTKYRPEYLEKKLDGYGYALIGTVGNLSEVDFRYTAEGKTVIRRITTEDATKFLGRDIKTCRTDAGALRELMNKAGL